MPIVDIPIANYKPFYIQYGELTTAKDTKAEWGMVAKTNPYPLLPTPKDTYNNDWKDEFICDSFFIRFLNSFYYA